MKNSKPIKTNIKLFYRKSGKNDIIAPEVPENTEFFLCALGIQAKYNELTGEIEYQGIVNGQDVSTFKADSIVPMLRGAFIRMKEFRISKSDLEDALRYIAYKYRYNELKEYLTECHVNNKDVKGQLEIFFEQFVLDETVSDSDKQFYFMLLKKWLVGAVVMAFNDGSKSIQGVLVLKGPQGLGKTRFLNALVPEHLIKYVKEGVSISKGTKDDKLHIMRKWIIELGELGYSLKNADIDNLKNIITESTDEIRKPYARSIERVPRVCSFLGTVNKDKFLKDDTGERRWWVIPIQDIKPLPTDFDINKMWGEIMELAFTEKYPYWLNREEIDRLNIYNMKFKTETNEENLLKDLLDWNAPLSQWQKVSASNLCERLGINKSQRSASTKIGHALRRMINSKIEPYSQVQAPTNNKDRRYLVPPLKSDKSNMYFESFQKVES